jgi:hypothetical protein
MLAELKLKLKPLIEAKAKERQKDHGGTAPGKKSLLPKSGEVSTKDELDRLPGPKHNTIAAVEVAGDVSRGRVYYPPRLDPGEEYRAGASSALRYSSLMICAPSRCVIVSTSIRLRILPSGSFSTVTVFSIVVG